jgi:hypothetical protein
VRQTCQLRAAEECGKPAVDFVMRIDDEGTEYKFWLCADHFDLLQRIRKLLNDENEDRDYKFRPPTPGKVDD